MIEGRDKEVRKGVSSNDNFLRIKNILKMLTAFLAESEGVECRWN